ncbi:hypothetical protein ACE6H2_006441 [Prunus campanulata]
MSSKTTICIIYWNYLRLLILLTKNFTDHWQLKCCLFLPLQEKSNPDDPKTCGDPRYSLSCENNRTVLYLYSGKYYAQSINYDNYTIRVVDVGLHKGNCSSLPRHSIAKYSFDQQDPYSFYQLKGKMKPGFPFPNLKLEHNELSQPIIFMTCKTPVSSPDLYVDTAPCIDARSSPNSSLSHPSWNSFVNVGHLNVLELRDSCRIELMVLAAPFSHPKDSNISYIDIHNELIYGFELSWLRSYERGQRLGCHIDKDTKKVHCVYERGRSGLDSTVSQCGKDIYQIKDGIQFPFLCSIHLHTHIVISSIPPLHNFL